MAQKDYDAELAELRESSEDKDTVQTQEELKKELEDDLRYYPDEPLAGESDA